MSFRLLRLCVEDFRAIQRCEVDFAENGVTVLHAPNETGKSSLIEAIELVLGEKVSSKKQAVRAVQPVGRDVGSFIELDAQLGAHRLTIRKRFNRNTVCELEITEPRVEQHSGDEAHDRLQELLSDPSVVDFTLFQALWFRQGRDLQALELSGSSALARALDARSGGRGVPTDDALVDRIDQEFRTYFTPSGKENKAVTETRRALESAENAVAEASEALAQLAGDVAELERVEREIDDANVLHAELTERVRVLAAQHAEVEAAEAALTSLGFELEAAAAVQARAVDAVAARRELADQVAAGDADVAALAASIEPLRRQLADQQDEVQLAVTARQEATAAHERALTAQQHVAAAIDRHTTTARRAEVARRITAAEQAHSTLATSRALVEANPVDAAALEELRTLDQAVHVARAALEAGAPTLRFAARSPTTVTIDGQAVPLGDGESPELIVEDRLRVELSDDLAFEVWAGTSAGVLHQRVADAAAALAARADQLGVADLDAAIVAHEVRLTAEADHERARTAHADALGESSFEDLTTELARLDVALERLDATGSDALALESVESLAELEALAAEASAIAADRLDERDAAIARHGVRTQQADATGSQLSAAEATLAERSRALGVDQQRLAHRRDEVSDESLAEDAAHARQQTARLERARAEAEQALAALDPAATRLLFTNATRALADTEATQRDARQRQTELQVRIETLGEHGLGEAHAQAEVEVQRTRAARDRLLRRAAAARLLKDHVDAAREATFASYRAPLRDAIVERAQILFGGDVDVELDDQLEISGRLDGRRRIDWEHLSSGAKEQLAVLTALAAASLAAEGGVPIVLDDTLGYTDPERLERLGAILGSSTDVQVLVLTCVPERFSRVGGARLVRLDTSRGGARSTAQVPVEALDGPATSPP